MAWFRLWNSSARVDRVDSQPCVEEMGEHEVSLAPPITDCDHTPYYLMLEVPQHLSLIPSIAALWRAL